MGCIIALLWQHNANPSYKLASIPRYDDIVWGLRARTQNVSQYMLVLANMLVLAVCLVEVAKRQCVCVCVLVVSHLWVVVVR